jgi:YgiT-type zinc finger domain-containing protein
MCLPFCHKWEVKETHENTLTSTYSGKVVAIEHVYILVCKKCGDVKKRAIDMTAG